MGVPYTARQCQVKFRIGGVITTLLASRATVHTNADRIDVTNFESGNDGTYFYGDFLAGVVSANVTIESYDSDTAADANDHWNGAVKSGTNSGEVYIYLTKPVNATRAWYFGSITINDVSSDNEAHGAVKSMITFFNRGRFYYPGEVKPVVAF